VVYEAFAVFFLGIVVITLAVVVEPSSSRSR